MRKIFLLAETIIYFAFIIFDLLKIESTYIKYLGIVLCFVYTIYNHKKLKSFAMLFTLIADFFLLVLDDYYEVGVLSFVVVQVIYIFYIKNISNKNFNNFLLSRFLVIIIGIIILYLTKNLSLLNVLIIIYFSNLLISAIQSYSIKSNMLAIGLTLFVCCDICVGLHNILPRETIASFLMWVFYLPSQALIVLS